MHKGAWWATVHEGHKEPEATEHTCVLTHSFINSLLTTLLSVITELHDDTRAINSYGPHLVELMIKK